MKMKWVTKLPKRDPMQNDFNLIDEPWIPVTGIGLVSLKKLFTNGEYRAIGGNPIQKIAITKFLLAIAQSAYTPKNDEDWVNIQTKDLAGKCLEYLQKWHDSFFLYGEKPFLQIPAIKAAAIQSFGAVLPDVSTGNTTVLTQSQKEKPLSDAEKALLLVQLMGFALGGKKTDNRIVLSKGYLGKSNDKGKPSTSKPGSSIGFLGFLHSYLHGKTLWESLKLNLLTTEDITQLTIYPQGLGVAPWEKMPQGENCSIALALKSTLMGRLVPVSRFCLLTKDGLHYSEGILHNDYQSGIADPSVSVNFSEKKFKVVWTDPNKRPWRLLTSLLSFLSLANSSGFDCPQLRLNMKRAKKLVPEFAIWSGGLRVSNNAGEQYVSGSDDYLESCINLDSSILGEVWFANFELEIKSLDSLSKQVYASTLAYFKSQNMESDGQAALASQLFWQLCEQYLDSLIHACDSATTSKSVRPLFARIANKVFDFYCPNDTGRQIDAWAKNRPNLAKYINNGESNDKRISR